MALFHRARREDLASRVERKGSELSQMAAEKGSESSRRISDILRRASEDIRSMDVGDYKARARDAMSVARGKVDDEAEMARDTIRSRPLTSIAVAIGIGMLAGAAVAIAGSRISEKYEY